MRLDMDKEIRWHQRYENFTKAFMNFKEAVLQVEHLSKLEKEGMVQRFEYTFELAWKTLKDFLEAQSVEVKFPRDVIKAGFQYELIRDGDVWMDMLDKRNLMAHTYDEAHFNIVISKIAQEYFQAIAELYDELGDRR